MKHNNRQKKLLKRVPFSIAFWSVFALVMAVLFFCNRGSISKTVTKLQGVSTEQKSKTVAEEVQGIVEKNVKRNEISIANADEQNTKQEKENFRPIETEETLEEERVQKDERLASTNEIETTKDKLLSSQLSKDENETEQDVQIQDAVDEAQQIARNSGVDSKDEKPSQKIEERQIEVYFATVSDSGAVSREKCVRTIAKSASPMVDSINSLLAGPTKDETKRGLRSFIPAETRLLSASIKDGSAHLNFSEDFQFNRYGVEGYNVQLQQVVFTACAFPTVNSVQFLIEGQKRDFIGSEGVWIGSPLTPSSF